MEKIIYILKLKNNHQLPISLNNNLEYYLKITNFQLSLTTKIDHLNLVTSETDRIDSESLAYYERKISQFYDFDAKFETIKLKISYTTEPVDLTTGI